jgi:hypothetical protein
VLFLHEVSNDILKVFFIEMFGIVGFSRGDYPSAVGKNVGDDMRTATTGVFGLYMIGFTLVANVRIVSDQG